MSIRDRLEIVSESWRPDLIGETDPETGAANNHPNPLVGTIVEVDQFHTDFGMAPSITVLGDDGNYWRWSVLGQVAQKRISNLQPAIGDEIGVKYLGTRPSPNFPGKEYADWRVVLERANGAQALPLTSEEPF